MSLVRDDLGRRAITLAAYGHYALSADPLPMQQDG